MFLLFLITFFLFSLSPVKALDEFNSQQNLTYQLDNQGNAIVTQEIQLTNNLSEIYPTVYQLSLYGPQITNVKGNDSAGNIVQKVDRTGDSNLINLKFNEANLGKDKITKFTLTYNISNLAIQKGNIWELSLPDYQNLKDTDIININIYVPSIYGSLSFSSNSPKNIIPLNNQTQIYFENIKNKKTLLIFGNYQLFDFNFKYFLQNNETSSKTLEIPLPPENDSQQIIFKEINPTPQNIKIDQDGNWLAQYKLAANQELEISVSGQAKIISADIKQEINIKDYLKPQIYWPIDDPSIKQLKFSNAKEIYNYVVNTLNYDYESINSATRKGALQALLLPNSSLCTEFTDLFVTLARSNGIPAREVEGFAYTNNSKIKPINTNADILHAWPQYYDQDQKSWVSIDPTWGKTTNGVDFFNDLDPNHFAFVFHGLDSQNPLPPGAYKNSHNIKTVQVEFATQELQSEYQNLKITPINNNFYQNQEIKITNPNYQSLKKLDISINSINWHQTIDQLPPLSSITLKIPNLSFLKSINPKNQKLELSINSQNSYNQKISLKNNQYFFDLCIFLALISTLVGIGGIIFTNNRKSKK